MNQTTPKDRRYLRLAIGAFILLLAVIVIIGLVSKPSAVFT